MDFGKQVDLLEFLKNGQFLYWTCLIVYGQPDTKGAFH